MNVINGLPPVITPDTNISLDIEMFGQTLGKLHRPHGRLASVQVGVGEDVYMLYDAQDLPALFERIANAKTFVLHNSLYDLRQLRAFIPIKKRLLWDTLLVERILFGGYYGGGEFGLNDLVRRYLGIHLEKETRSDFATATYMTDDMKHYAALDAYYTLKVKQAQDAEIAKRKYDMYTYYEIDEPCIWTVMDFKPIKINVKRWLEMAMEFEQRGRDIENELGFNTKSWAQVADQIKRRSGFNMPTKKDTGNPVTDEAALIANRDKIGIELCDKILLARQYRTAASTFGKRWIDKYVEEDGLVYSDISVTGAETGRTISSNPNLNQIPSRKIPEYRKLFVTNQGKLIVADIQAQEPRCLAYLSGDKNLRAIFERKEDVHLEVAKAAFRDDSITKSDPRRDVGKIINLATSYGMTAEGMAKRLRVDVKQTEEFLRGYFTRFSDVRLYIDNQRMKARQQEYVESVTGRRIWVNRHSYQWENNAINAPIQASAADYTKMWMNKYWEACNREGIPFPVTMSVYDELVSDVAKELEPTYIKLLNDTAQDTAQTLFGDMPFELEVESGRAWSCKKGDEDGTDL